MIYFLDKHRTSLMLPMYVRFDEISSLKQIN